MNQNFPSSISGLRSPQRILIRGTNWLGDAVMTTPALFRLRERFPRAHIALLTPDKLRELWIRHPAVDDVIPFQSHETVFAIAKKMRVEKFDVALVLPNSPRSAMETWLARIPQRIGYARPWRNLFLTRAVAPRIGEIKMRKRSPAEIKTLIAKIPDRGSRTPDARPAVPVTAHQIYDYLHLSAALGASSEPLPPRLVVDGVEVNEARKKFIKDHQGLVFGLNPGAEYGPAKRWPVERFIATVKEVQQQANAAWVLFGGKNDARITTLIETELLAGWQRNQKGPRPIIFNLAGQTTLLELMALLKLCRVLLTNDTGPTHVAAALGVPVVVPFGSTSPELTGPISSRDIHHQIFKSDVPCAPCFLRECPIDFRCMNGIRVDRVSEAVLRAAC